MPLAPTPIIDGRPRPRGRRSRSRRPRRREGWSAMSTVRSGFGRSPISPKRRPAFPLAPPPRRRRSSSRRTAARADRSWTGAGEHRHATQQRQPLDLSPDVLGQNRPGTAGRHASASREARSSDDHPGGAPVPSAARDVRFLEGPLDLVGTRIRRRRLDLHRRPRVTHQAYSTRTGRCSSPRNWKCSRRSIGPVTSTARHVATICRIALRISARASPAPRHT